MSLFLSKHEANVTSWHVSGIHFQYSALGLLSVIVTSSTSIHLLHHHISSPVIHLYQLDYLDLRKYLEMFQSTTLQGQSNYLKNWTSHDMYCLPLWNYTSMPSTLNSVYNYCTINMLEFLNSRLVCKVCNVLTKRDKSVNIPNIIPSGNHSPWVFVQPLHHHQ